MIDMTLTGHRLLTELMLNAGRASTDRNGPSSNSMASCRRQSRRSPSAVPADLIRWTHCRTLVATARQFHRWRTGGHTVPVSLRNNVHICPAVGLGVGASGRSRVTDAMMVAAARANPAAPLLPAVNDLRRIAVAIAIAVGLEAQRRGLAPGTSSDELRTRTMAKQWTPLYPGSGPTSA